MGSPVWTWGDFNWGEGPWGPPTPPATPPVIVNRPGIENTYRQWYGIYSEIASILLEPGGFVSGTLTDEQFFTMAGEVLTDFCSATGFAKKIFNQTLNLGVGVYGYSSQVSEVEEVVAEENYLDETSDFYLSNTDRRWGSDLGFPEAWREDSIEPMQIQIYPAPAYEGSQILIAAGQGGYGDISTSVPGTLTIEAGTPGVGAVSGESDGNVYLDTTNPGYGLIASMVTSDSNLEIFATALPYQLDNIGKATYIELIPTDFIPYLKYGLLFKIYSSDSELKSESKAKYSKARYEEGVSLLKAILSRM